MGRRIEVLEVPEGPAGAAVTITSEELGYEAAEDLLPEVLDVVGAVADRVGSMIASGAISGSDDVLKLAPAFGALAGKLSGGRLKRLVPKVVAGTSVTMPGPDGSKSRFDLVKSEERTTVFDARPDLYFKVLLHAVRTSFGRFFPGLGQLGKKESPKAT